MSAEVIQSKELQILEAAEREFLEKGYDGARTISIAKTAGVTHAMLHYYFRTKEQLFERIIDKKMKEIVPLMTHLFGNSDFPLVKRIEEAVSAHFDFVVANPDLPKFLINEVLPHQHRCEMFRAKVADVLHLFDYLQTEVDDAANRGEVEHFHVVLLFQTILSLNILAVAMTHFAENMMGGDASQFESLLAARKAENIETIMRRIKKTQ